MNHIIQQEDNRSNWIAPWMRGVELLGVLCVLLCSSYLTCAQFPPAAGVPGSTAIYKDSSVIVAWASEVLLKRGWHDIQSKEQEVDHGRPTDALGKADGVAVSLGDSGQATLIFDPPIRNGPGPDFAVFENGFDNTFLELAHVEVSSDGEHYFRFPSISLTDTSVQVETFGQVDPTKVHNLAGKYRVLYGTPFDLSELPDTSGLDKERVRYVRLLDVVGAVAPSLGTRDGSRRIINDPYPTPFATGGFDLDAVGALHLLTSAQSPDAAGYTLHPNPLAGHRQLAYQLPHSGRYTLQLRTMTGRVVRTQEVFISSGKGTIDCSELDPGTYIFQCMSRGKQLYSSIFVVQ